jgi:hypothetical protein
MSETFSVGMWPLIGSALLGVLLALVMAEAGLSMLRRAGGSGD